MNALRAPLTALHALTGEVCFFALDSADAFIDSRLGASNVLVPPSSACVQW